MLTVTVCSLLSPGSITFVVNVQESFEAGQEIVVGCVLHNQA